MDFGENNPYAFLLQWSAEYFYIVPIVDMLSANLFGTSCFSCYQFLNLLHWQPSCLICITLCSKKFISGRGWKASELRFKSWDDLHKLWFVLLKEKNMLMTQRQMLHAQNLRFPNPERIPKVCYSSLYSLLECLNMFRCLLSLLNDLVVIGNNACLVILVIIPGF